MAQQSLSNGPILDGGNPIKHEMINQDVNPKLNTQDQPLVTAPSSQPSGPFLARPPLSRSDSRTNFQYRPPFPSPGSPHSIGPQILGGHQPPGFINSGPQSLSPQVISGYQSTSPVNSGYPTSPINSGPQSIGPQVLRSQQPGGVRSPVAGQPFVQRGPPLGPGGTQGPRLSPQGSNPVPSPPYQQTHGQRPLFRPQSPFSRPPLLAQRPQIFQQSSVPAFNRQRPGFDEQLLNRSQTLDSSELNAHKYEEENISLSGEQRPPSVASVGRSYSIDANPNQNMDRKISSSQESINISRQSSQENIYKKEENALSRPESRSGSRMGKIVENENTQNRSRPESRGEVVNGDVGSRSPKKESPNHITYVTTPRVEDLQEEIKKQETRDMELKLKSNKGDNDSGVDESTQGNEQCNGDSRTPRKPINSRTSSSTPTKGRSVSRGGSKPPSNLQSPDSAATTPGSASERKKVPMNKIQVGSAPSPNLKVVRSKIGSLENASYKPGGGKVKIESRKLDFKNAGSRIEAKNDKYVSKGGDKKDLDSARSVRSTSPRKIMSQKLEWNAKSKIGSLENAAHKPKGGDKKIETVKLNFKEKATAKVGSKDNIKYQPGGGEVKRRGKSADIQEDIENRKLEIHASSKVGSMDNVKHKPAGGYKKIFDDKEYLKQQGKSGKSSMDHSLSGSQHSVQSQEPKAPVADENLNQEH